MRTLSLKRIKLSKVSQLENPPSVNKNKPKGFRYPTFRIQFLRSKIMLKTESDHASKTQSGKVTSNDLKNLRIWFTSDTE